MIPQRGGLPHSDTSGSTPARGSPKIFAACHVLHRLLAPRHPPDALLILKTRNSRQSPVIRPEINDRSKASHRTHPTGVSSQGSVCSHSTTNHTPLLPDRAIHTHTSASLNQSSVVSRQTSGQRDTSPSDGLRPPSCPDRPETQQNLIHNHQRTYRP